MSEGICGKKVGEKLFWVNLLGCTNTILRFLCVLAAVDVVKTTLYMYFALLEPYLPIIICNVTEVILGSSKVGIVNVEVVSELNWLSFCPLKELYMRGTREVLVLLQNRFMLTPNFI